MAPLKVIEQHLIRDRYERLVRARTTLDPWFLANPSDPLIGAGRSVPPLLRLGVLPELGEDIRPADEQRAKERHLFTLGPRRPFGIGRQRRLVTLFARRECASQVRQTPLRRKPLGIQCGKALLSVHYLPAKGVSHILTTDSEPRHHSAR